MDNNPYQTPESELKVDAQFKRSIWWKIYFFFITTMSALGMVSFLVDPNAGITEYISLSIWLVATVGLFGFVFLKPIYKPEFWLSVLIAYISYSAAYYFITDVDLRAAMSDSEYYVSNAIGWLLSVPAFYGLFSFSRPANPIWKSA